MFVRRFRFFLVAIATAVAAFVAVPQAGVSEPAWGANKLEGAWIAKDTLGQQWSYVIAPDSSGRHAVGHGSIEVGVSVGSSFGEIDRLSPLLVDIVMTDRDTAAYTGVWYALGETPPDSMVGSEVLLIGTATGELQFIGPDKLQGFHTLSFYVPGQDADGDGLPDPGEVPVITVQSTSLETRLRFAQ